MKTIQTKSILGLIIFSFLAFSINFTEAASSRSSSLSQTSSASLDVAPTQTRNTTGPGNGGNNQVNIAPTIASATVTNISQTSVTLNSSVNPNGTNTIAWFETPTGGPYQSQSLGNGNFAVTLTTYNLTGLTANTTYTFRVAASNAAGNTFGSWISFTTLSNTGNGGNGGSGGGGGGGYIYALVTTTGSTGITKSSAVLNGSVITHGLSTTVWFEYGTASNLSSSSQTAHMYANSGNYSSPFSQSITGLNANTVYYFRAVANAPSGTRYGDILSFRTAQNIVTNNNQNSGSNTDDNYPQNENSNSETVALTENTFAPNDTTNEDNYGLAASSIFGSGTFLPSTLLGWILLLIILFIIFILIRKIMHLSRKKVSKEKSADHIENLPL